MLLSHCSNTIIHPVQYAVIFVLFILIPFHYCYCVMVTNVAISATSLCSPLNQIMSLLYNRRHVSMVIWMWVNHLTAWQTRGSVCVGGGRVPLDDDVPWLVRTPLEMRQQLPPSPFLMMLPHYHHRVVIRHSRVWSNNAPWSTGYWLKLSLGWIRWGQAIGR